MEINDDLIDKLATLSRLRFDADEKAAIRKDLQQMLGFIDKLNEIDTNGVSPLMHISENENVFREDKLSTATTREDALRNATGKHAAFFTVPKVIAK